MPTLSDGEETQTNPFSGADLFDAEIDDDSGEENRTPPASPSSPFSEQEDIPLSKGKGKSNRQKYAKKKESNASRPKKQRASKKSAEMEIAAMHMESQRLLRESAVVIPKYQNKAKSLDAFLAKLKKPLAQDDKKKKTGGKQLGAVQCESTPVTDSLADDRAKPGTSQKDDLKVSSTIVPHLSSLGIPANVPGLASSRKDQFIDLAGPERKRTVGQTTPDSTTSNGQVQQLMERFLRHSSQPAAKKTPVGLGPADTKAESSLQPLSSSSNGLQRDQLQHQLRDKMKQQRALERQKANEQRQIEEEIGFSDEEEAEFTDESDSNKSDEDNSDKEIEQDGAEEKEKEEDVDELFAGKDVAMSDVGSDSDDLSAAEESESEEDNEREDSDDDGSDDEEENILSSITRRRRTSDERQLLLSDDDDEEEFHKGQAPDKLDMLINGAEVSYSLDDFQSGFPSAQPRRAPPVQEPDHAGSMDSLSLRSTDTQSVASSAGKLNISQKASSLSSLSLPVEDSQDLYSLNEDNSTGSGLHALIQAPLKKEAQLLSNTTNQSSQTSASSLLSPDRDAASSESSCLGDTGGFRTPHSPNPIGNLLAAGLRSTGSMGSEGTLSLFSDSQPQSTMNELLQMCSGTFATQANATQDSQLILSATSQSPASSSGMSELIGLCSGRFDTQPSQAHHSSNTQPSQSYRSSGNSSFNAAALDECANMEMPTFPSSRQQGESDDEELPLLRGARRAPPEKGATSIHKNLLAYVEEEAELSGSDAGPDDDDLGSSADEYEIEENSEEENLPKGAALAKQINRVHQKVALADDDANLRTYKELILGDADFEEGMNMDGFFRTRRYRPSLDDGSQLDLFDTRGSDESSHEDDDDQREAKRRRERHARTTFLYNQRLKQSDDSLLLQDEDSQIILSCMKDNSQSGFTKLRTKRPQGQVKCGSFLSRSKATLTRLQSQTSAALNLNGSTRSFVFQKRPALQEANNSNKSVDVSAKPVLRRSSSLPQGSAAKRPRIDRRNSVFQKF